MLYKGAVHLGMAVTQKSHMGGVHLKQHWPSHIFSASVLSGNTYQLEIPVCTLNTAKPATALFNVWS
jgi:hypothetical protein